MALEALQTLIFNKLEEKGYATTIKSAKKMIERRAARGYGTCSKSDPGAPGGS